MAVFINFEMKKKMQKKILKINKRRKSLENSPSLPYFSSSGKQSILKRSTIIMIITIINI